MKITLNRDLWIFIYIFPPSRQDISSLIVMDDKLTKYDKHKE